MKKNNLIYIGILLFIFLIDMIMVIFKLTDSFDIYVRNIIYSNTSEFVSDLMHNITFLGSTIFIVSCCAVVFFAYIYKKQKGKSFSIAGTLIVSTIINNVIKYIIRRPRPEYMSVTETTFSFPSGHMMGATTFYGFLIYLLLRSNVTKKYKIIYSIILVLIILSVGTSRIYLGAHFATDIIGGLLLSASLILLFDYLDSKYNWIEKK